MSRSTMTAALALMLAAAVPAYAQTSSSSTSSPSTSASSASNSATHVTATQLQPGQIRATQMDGATVYDTQNQKVGDVKDIILDRDGKVAAVVLDVGAFLGIGGKYVAVGMLLTAMLAGLGAWRLRPSSPVASVARFSLPQPLRSRLSHSQPAQ